MALANRSHPLYQRPSSRRIVSLPEILTEDQIMCINQLLGWALLDDSIRQRLVLDRDPELMCAHGLSALAQQWLHDLPVSTLQALAEQVMAGIEIARAQRFPPPS